VVLIPELPRLDGGLYGSVVSKQKARTHPKFSPRRNGSLRRSIVHSHECEENSAGSRWMGSSQEKSSEKKLKRGNPRAGKFTQRSCGRFFRRSYISAEPGWFIRHFIALDGNKFYIRSPENCNSGSA